MEREKKKNQFLLGLIINSTDLSELSNEERKKNAGGTTVM